LPRLAWRRTLAVMIDPRRALLSQVVGREVLVGAVRALAPAGVTPVVLKGVWLQACVYTQQASRVVTDVDLLVPERRFEHALIALEHAGWRRRSSDVRAVSLEHAEMQLPIDLHRQLFTRGAFRLSTDAVFERSHVDHAAFDVTVRLPDPRDGLAHLIGHFVKSRMRRDDPDRLRDFVAITRRYPLEPENCARHLYEVGMARAARYVLHHLAYTERDDFHRELVEALPRDPLAEPIVQLARRIASDSGTSGVLGAMPGFLLDRSLPAGARALVLRALDLLHERGAQEFQALRSR